MLITQSSANAYVRPSASPKSETSNVTFHNEPIDGWNPGESPALASLAPYSLATIAAAGGLVAGFADGTLAMAGGAVAGGAAGAAGAFFLSAMSEFGSGKPNYTLNSLVGAGLGAAAGAWAGSVGGPVVGLLAAGVGGGGGFLLGNFLK